MEDLSNNFSLLFPGQHYTLFPTPVLNKQFVGSLKYVGETDKGYCFTAHEGDQNMELFFGRRSEVTAYVTDALNQTGLCEGEAVNEV